VWVGQEADSVLVFDPESQVKGSGFVLLWNAKTRQLETYLARLLRSHVKKVDDATAAPAAAAYQAWLATSRVKVSKERAYLTARLDREQEEAAKARVALLTPQERHKEFLSALGLDYTGVRKAMKGWKHRTTHCYACKAELDNSWDTECNSCDWIICPTCGACGCGYER
jgi:hypothetical protein